MHLKKVKGSKSKKALPGSSGTQPDQPTLFDGTNSTEKKLS